MARCGRRPVFGGVRWRTVEAVRLTTLDDLIAHHGRPAFCKIDVEGYEAEVLRGPSEGLALISFEYIPAAMDVARACLTRLTRWVLTSSTGSRRKPPLGFQSEWLSPAGMAAQLEKLAAGRASGDIFARLVSVARYRRGRERRD